LCNCQRLQHPASCSTITADAGAYLVTEARQQQVSGDACSPCCACHTNRGAVVIQPMAAAVAQLTGASSVHAASCQDQ
jgi:hypothetical protein